MNDKNSTKIDMQETFNSENSVRIVVEVPRTSFNVWQVEVMRALALCIYIMEPSKITAAKGTERVEIFLLNKEINFKLLELDNASENDIKSFLDEIVSVKGANVNEIIFPEQSKSLDDVEDFKL